MSSAMNRFLSQFVTIRLRIITLSRPCILHHIETTTREYINCPLCDSDIHPDELKSVCLVKVGQPKRDHPIQLDLMLRNKLSMLVMPASRCTSMHTLGSSDISAFRVIISCLFIFAMQFYPFASTRTNILVLYSIDTIYKAES